MDIDTRDPRFKRNLFICKFYDQTGGSLEPAINSQDLLELARKWGFNDDEIKDYMNYFEQKRYIKTSGGIFGSIMPLRPRLIADGVDYVLSINCKKIEELNKGLHNISLDIDR